MDMKESMSKVDDSGEVHDVVCRDLQAAGTRTFEVKLKAGDSYERIQTHGDRCRRATKELETAEEDLDDSLGRMGQLKKDTVGATHALSCGESNEARYLQEALDMIGKFRGQGPAGERPEITPVERQKTAHLPGLWTGSKREATEAAFGKRQKKGSSPVEDKIGKHTGVWGVP